MSGGSYDSGRAGFPRALRFWAAAALAAAAGCRTLTSGDPPLPAGPAAPELAAMGRLALAARLGDAQRLYEEQQALYAGGSGDFALGFSPPPSARMDGPERDAWRAKWRALAERHPASPEPWRHLARLEFAESNLRAAAAAMAEAAARANGRPDVAAEHANVRLHAKDPAGALAALRDADRTGPAESLDPLLRTTRALVRIPDLCDEVRGFWTELAEARPDCAPVRMRIGAILEELGEADEALAWYRAAGERAADDATVVAPLWALLHRLGRLDELFESARTTLPALRRPLPLRAWLAQRWVEEALRREADPAASRAAWEEARALLESTHHALPRDRTVAFLWGRTLAALGRFDEALAAWAPFAGQDDAPFRHALAAQLAADALPGEVADRLAGRAGPASRLAEFLRAELLVAADRREEADRVWSALRSGPPAESSVALRLAMLRARTEGPDAASDTLREALQSLPGEPSLVTLEMLIALVQGEPMRAFDLARTIPALYQGQPPALTGAHRPTALALQYAGWPEEARSAWIGSGGAADDPAMGGHLWLCGWIDERTGRRDETRALLVSAQRSAPQDPEWAFAAGLYELQAKAYEPALRSFNRARALEARQAGSGGTPLRGAIRFYRAAALERLGRWTEAEPELSAIAESEGESVHEAQNYLAFALADRALDLDRAEAMIARALAVEPRNAAYLDTRGWIRFRQERFAEARRDLEAAAARDPDEGEIRAHLAETLERLGEPEAARREWRAAYVRDPEVPGLRAALAVRGLDSGPWEEERRAWLERWRWNFEPLLRGVNDDDFSVAADPAPVGPESAPPAAGMP